MGEQENRAGERGVRKPGQRGIGRRSPWRPRIIPTPAEIESGAANLERLGKVARSGVEVARDGRDPIAAARERMEQDILPGFEPTLADSDREPYELLNRAGLEKMTKAMGKALGIDHQRESGEDPEAGV